MSGDETEETHESPESPESGGAPAARRSQVPAHVPPHLRDLFTKHEGAVAERPGFRNKPNAKTKAQKRPTTKKR
jgi:hypothetical protein